MRGTMVMAAITAVAACGLGATPAAAVTARPAPAAASAAAAGSASGTRCTTVESHSPLRVGAVCVTLVSRGVLWRAEVSFKAGSGSLRQVSVKNLRFLVAGGVKERTGRVLKGATGRTDFVPSNWWEDDLPGVFGRAAVFNACMQWRDGARACTGSHWFYSLRVRL
jgi:hypothetical protein